MATWTFETFQLSPDEEASFCKHAIKSDDTQHPKVIQYTFNKRWRSAQENKPKYIFKPTDINVFQVSRFHFR